MGLTLLACSTWSSWLQCWLECSVLGAGLSLSGTVCLCPQVSVRETKRQTVRARLASSDSSDVLWIQKQWGGWQVVSSCCNNRWESWYFICKLRLVRDCFLGCLVFCFLNTFFFLLHLSLLYQWFSTFSEQIPPDLMILLPPTVSKSHVLPFTENLGTENHVHL